MMRHVKFFVVLALIILIGTVSAQDGAVAGFVVGPEPEVVFDDAPIVLEQGTVWMNRVLRMRSGGGYYFSTVDFETFGPVRGLPVEWTTENIEFLFQRGQPIPQIFFEWLGRCTWLYEPPSGYDYTLMIMDDVSCQVAYSRNESGELLTGMHGATAYGVGGAFLVPWQDVLNTGLVEFDDCLGGLVRPESCRDATYALHNA